MRLEIAERLCCPREHVRTPLVVVANLVEGRDLLDGVAGCPVCHFEARVRNGDVWFGEETRAPAAASSSPVSRHAVGEPGAGEAAASVARLLALLGLAEPGGAVLLTGGYGPCAAALARSSGTSVVLMHADPEIAEDGVAIVRGVHGLVPFTDASFRAVALAPGVPESFVADAVRAVTPGGRVLGASALPVPPGVRELARDDSEWVGEREALTAMISLGRGRRP